MAGYCMSVQPYFHEPQASENTAQESNDAIFIYIYIIYLIGAANLSEPHTALASRMMQFSYIFLITKALREEAWVLK